jgi:hypothetical protein
MPGLGASVSLLGVPEDGLLTVPLTASLTDQLNLHPTLDTVQARSASYSENLGINDAMTLIRGIVLLETLNLTEQALPVALYGLLATDSINTLDEPLVGWPLSLTDGLGVHPSDVATLAIAVIENLGLTETVTTALTYGLSLSDTLTTADTLANFFGMAITDALNVSELLAGVASMPTTLSDALNLSESLTSKLVFSATTHDTIDLTDAQILQMIFSGTVADSIDLLAAYLSPQGQFTTWAMNTRTVAVTEYTNYEFNSFARMGNIYLGASANGLYELTGEDDDGADIISTIRSGFAEWAGAKFAMFQSIYLGVRSDGDFVLKVITGDSQEYIYAVNAQSMRTTKIATGKGLRARYWAFELISTGQDFDLDTIEFVPIASNRRV